MSKDKVKLALTVNIKREDEQALVFYKQDGQRFESNCTIKMNVETTYKISVNFRPPQRVKLASFKNTSLDVKEDEFTKDSSTFSILWTSNDVTVSKKNSRERFPLSLTVQDMGVLELMFQLKFYKSDDKGHSVWGNEMHHIEYECSYKVDSAAFEVNKEVFR